jgi:hypothetical protein
MTQIAVGSDLYIFSHHAAANVNAHALIWAHGIQCTSHSPFGAGAGKTVHFYVQDGWELNYVKSDAGTGLLGTFRRYINNNVQPVDTYAPTSQATPNYKLSKAAENHVPNPGAVTSYAELDALVANRNFDIISIRNRAISSGVTLRDVVNLTNYGNYHCFFCRAPKNGPSSGLIAAQSTNHGHTAMHV